MARVNRALFLAAALTALAFLLGPIAVLAGRTFQSGALSALNTAPVRDALLLSLGTSTASLALTLLFGTPLAYLLARERFRGRRLLIVLVELPIVLPPAVAGLALLLTLGRRGALGPLLSDLGISVAFTTLAVIAAQTFVAAPFYVRAAQVGFAAVPPDVENAARVDGASGMMLFWWVTLPLAARGLGAGLALTWARALGEFGATILFAGSLQGRTQTMPLLIYAVFERDIDAAVATGLLLVVIALVALVMVQVVSVRQDTPNHSA